MGLLCELNLHDLGFWPSSRNYGIVADYSKGNQVFQNTFHSVISELCPVATGYLLGSIHCSADGMTISAFTLCEYAECVEYGTSRQAAQPYFEAAISSAFDAAYTYWESAYEAALAIEWQLVFFDVYQQAVAGSKSKADSLFAENWAINAANTSIETQRTYLEVGMEVPEVYVI